MSGSEKIYVRNNTSGGKHTHTHTQNVKNKRSVCCVMSKIGGVCVVTCLCCVVFVLPCFFCVNKNNVMIKVTSLFILLFRVC